MPELPELNDSAMVEHALAWARRGFRVFPLVPRQKKPAMRGWIEAATTDEEIIRKVWSAKDYNIGVLTDDMLVVDIDTKNGKPGLVSFFELEIPAETLTVKTPTGGYHRYYKSASVKGTVGLEPGIDLRSFHNYVVAPGSVVEAGTYELIHDAQMADLPVEFVERLDAPRPRESKDTAIELDLPVSIERASQWIGSYAPLAVDGDSGNATTYRVAAQLKDFGVSEEAALDLMLEDWNGRCSPPWEPEELQGVIANAFYYGTRRPGVESPAYELEGVDIPEVPVKQQAASRYRRLTAADIRAVRPKPSIIKGKLARKDFGCIFGQPGAGKSILAPYLALCVAQGKPFFGMKVRQGLVFYVAAEDTDNLARRIAAAKLVHGEADALHVIAGLDGMMADTGSPEMKDFLEDVQRLQPSLVIIDTLAVGFAIEDENKSGDMLKVVKVCRLANELGPAVVVVHHSPKSDGSTPRGHGSLNGALDLAIRVDTAGVSGVTVCVATKNRNGICSRFGFKTRSEPLDIDEYGEPDTKPVLEEVDLRALPEGEKLAGAKLDAVTILDELAASTADGRVSSALWRERCIAPAAISDASDEKGRVKAFNRARSALIAARVIVEGEDAMGEPWVSRRNFDYSAGVKQPKM